MVAAIPPHLCKNLGVQTRAPECYKSASENMTETSSENEYLDASAIAAMRLFEKFCDFPATEAERLALWGLTEEEIQENPEVSAAKVKPKSSWFGSDITWEDPRETGVYPPSDFKNQRFKLSCNILEGPWVVRSSVPNVPVMLGQKVVLRYFRGQGYCEIDVHIASSSIALRTVGTARGYAKNFINEIGIWLQGESEDELPERMLCCLSMVNPDCNVNRRLD